MKLTQTSFQKEEEKGLVVLCIDVVFLRKAVPALQKIHLMIKRAPKYILRQSYDSDVSVDSETIYA